MLQKFLEPFGARQLLVILTDLGRFEVRLIPSVNLKVSKLCLRFDLARLLFELKDRLRFFLLGHLLTLTFLEPSFPLSVTPLFFEYSVPLSHEVTCLILESFEFLLPFKTNIS